ncbi:MAG: lipoprotein [Methylotenera sp.]|nr:lipoprotein [Methylotenera sp.]
MFKLKSHLFNATALCLFCSTLMGCGTKGPLYIPEQRYPQEASNPTSDINKLDADKAPSTQPTVKE